MEKNELCVHDFPGGADCGCEKCIEELAGYYEESRFEKMGEVAFGRPPSMEEQLRELHRGYHALAEDDPINPRPWPLK